MWGHTALIACSFPSISLYNATLRNPFCTTAPSPGCKSYDSVILGSTRSANDAVVMAPSYAISNNDLAGGMREGD